MQNEKPVDAKWKIKTCWPRVEKQSREEVEEDFSIKTCEQKFFTFSQIRKCCQAWSHAKFP